MPQAVAAFLVKLGISKLIATVIATVVVNVGIAIGTNALIGALFGRRGGNKPSDGQVNVNEAVGSRRRHYGIVHTGGQRSFLDSANGTLGIVVTLGTGREGEIIEHRINDQPVTLSGGTVTGASYHGAIHIHTRDGDPDQSAIGELTAKFANWTSDHRQRGCAHAAIICDPVKQEWFSEVFNGQMPVYTQVRWGAHLYDPRKDSTAVIGYDLGGAPIMGSGPHRLGDETTWETSDNAALVIADYFAHPDGYGGGYDAVNWTCIAGEADAADDPQLTVGSEEIARWRLWASYSLATTERRKVMADMLIACDGFTWQDADGRFCLKLGRWEEPRVIITDDHIRGLTATLGPRAQQRVDAIKVLYTEQAIGWREQESATVFDPDGETDPNTDPQALEAYYAPHHNQAVRIGKLTFERLRDDRWHVTALLDLSGLDLIGERFCRIVSSAFATPVDFMIVGGPRLNLRDMSVEVTLDQVREADWSFDAETEEGEPPIGSGSYSAPPPLAAPTGLVLTAVQIALGEGSGVAIAASWDDPGRPDLRWEARYAPASGGDWVTMTVDLDGRSARSGPVDSGTAYDVQVRAVSPLGRTSAWTEDTITPEAIPTLAAPSELAATGAAGSAEASFRMPTGASLAYARLYRGTTGSFGSAVQVGSDIVGGLGEVMTVTDSGLTAGTKYYWARAFSATGAASALAGPVTATVT